MTDKLTGLLCHDDSKLPWQDKVREAAARYQARSWLAADVCHVHPDTIQADHAHDLDDVHIATVDGVDVIIKTDILRNHFFVARRGNGHPPVIPVEPPPDVEQLQLL